MQGRQLAFRDSQLRVGFALIVGEFDFKNSRGQNRHHGSDPAAPQAFVGLIGDMAFTRPTFKRAMVLMLLNQSSGLL